MRTIMQGLPGVRPFQGVALWGRSLGAVAALGCAVKNPGLAGIVCDSAYADIASLLEMPGFLSTPLTGLCQWASMASTWGRTAAHLPKHTEVQPLEHARQCHAPALFLHGMEDNLVPAEHSKSLRAAYGDQAQILLMPGCDHDSCRPPASVARCALFLARALRIKGDAVSEIEEFLSASSGYTADSQTRERSVVAMQASQAGVEPSQQHSQQFSKPLTRIPTQQEAEDRLPSLLSDLSGSLMSKPVDSLALSLSTVQSEETGATLQSSLAGVADTPQEGCLEEPERFEGTVIYVECTHQEALDDVVEQHDSGSDDTDASESSLALESRSWPDVKESQIQAANLGRRHTWASTTEMLIHHP
eukprot:TRINITY_DN65346_c0_g1_i1.p1 TRINITY_DN65346_c0_g1~~TRINITY_DN65346_c0_g1_i1.p1  ORF type:complete len:360 (+),score=55.22 TRINITY_DN65346_c0_g1_i1:464-1543(+)